MGKSYRLDKNKLYLFTPKLKHIFFIIIIITKYKIFREVRLYTYSQMNITVLLSCPYLYNIIKRFDQMLQATVYDEN